MAAKTGKSSRTRKYFKRKKGAVGREGGHIHPLSLPSVFSILLKNDQYFVRIKSVYGILVFYGKNWNHKSQYIALFSHTPFTRMERAWGFK
ncbi:MAG: hypothetical protein GXY80_00820 [Syntrophorhabdus aromaticivorans]|uniref:Uncharacterized protein n=1 Tax=Syntrophorhabdus aromaticivorans TaxID=328301 RepID=A0A351U4F5_9BACT|nr:hypothetical protein [Syntrophorhabdus aromaticivorans]HBA54836.1 hypothetical protein [Syntrophorhabdus aromaticivorans]